MAVKKYHPFSGMFNVVESIDTPDPHTVVFNLEQRHPALLIALCPALSPIMPKHIYDDGQELTSHPRNSQDVVGSGAFTSHKFVTGKEIILERFEVLVSEECERRSRHVLHLHM